jgi:hypothetical protein
MSENFTCVLALVWIMWYKYQNLENNKWNLGQYFIYIWYTYKLIYNVKWIWYNLHVFEGCKCNRVFVHYTQANRVLNV